MKNLNTAETDQIKQVMSLLKDLLNQNLISLYLYGSAVTDGLQKHSDIDLFSVIDRPLISTERERLIKQLLEISCYPIKDSKRPIELSIVVLNEIKPWCFPPKCNFQYGEWLREGFKNGNYNLSGPHIMPDLATLISQIFMVSKTLFGKPTNDILDPIPYNDLFSAMISMSNELKSELFTDSRNVLLTQARIWHTMKTKKFWSKQQSARWAIQKIPEKFKPVLERAYLMCIDKHEDNWEDMRDLLTPCFSFIHSEIQTMSKIEL